MRSEDGYVRKPGRNQRPKSYQFVNPYPQMSETEARIFIFLRGLGVPFSWRQFDGKAQAPQFSEFMPSFVPEFTLTEYKIVILTIGSYWGTLPGILDNNGLAAAFLEADGWKVALIWEQEIRNDVAKAILDKLPELKASTIRGGPKNFPESYDKTYLDRIRQFARANAFKRRKYFTEGKTWVDRTSVRKPKSGDRRRSATIEREVKPQETPTVGGSRLRGTFNFNFNKSKYKSARSTKFSEPLYRKQPEKGQQ